MFDEIYDSLNAKIEQEMRSTADRDLENYSDNKFANIQMMISDFSPNDAPRKPETQKDWQETLQKNKDFKKLKEYIEDLKIELYSQETTVSALKEKLRISEKALEEERARFREELDREKEARLGQRKEGQAKVDRLLQEKRGVSQKVEEMVEYIAQLVKGELELGSMHFVYMCMICGGFGLNFFDFGFLCVV